MAIDTFTKTGVVEEGATPVEHADDDEESEEYLSVLADGWGPYLSSTLKVLAFGGALNPLLLCTPVAFVLH